MLSFRWHLISYLCGLWMQRVSQPTLIVTRFEYANLFHTVTDWYSAYMTSRIVNLKKRPRVVFVDGHCKVHLNSILLLQCFALNDFLQGGVHCKMVMKRMASHQLT